MESEAERTLSNLHVLSALSQNDKLNTNEDVFDIYAPTSLRGVWRTWYGEKRGQNVTRVRQTVRAGIAFSHKSLEEVHTLSQSSNRLRMETVALQHLRMVEGLRRAKDGIANLLQTYREDAALSSQITLVMTEVEDFLKVIHPHSEGLRRIESSA